ncbi:TetR/AcrR family transcriptional regulator [Coprobacter sp.]
MNEDLRKRIIVKSSFLFAKHGIKSVTMDYIAGQMGISKRTLYENFKDKDQLLLECIIYMQTETEKEVEDVCRTSENSLDLLLKVFYCTWQKVQNINRNYFSDVRRYHPGVAQLLENDKTERADYMADLMERGKKEGLIREDLKSKIVAFLLTAQFDFLFNSDEVFALRYSFVDVYETIFMNFIRGIATPKGIVFIDDFMGQSKKEQK